MRYREINAVCSEINAEYINTLCGQNVELFNVEPVVHIVTARLWKARGDADGWGTALQPEGRWFYSWWARWDSSLT